MISSISENVAPASLRCDVILTDAGNEVGFQVLKLLAKAGFAVIACDRNPGSLVRHSKYAIGVSRTLAAQDEKNFVRQIRRLEQESGARIIIPVFYAEVLSRHKDEFDAAIPVASSETLAMLDDKLRACALAASLGILQPRMYSSPAEVDRFPVVFKRTTGHSGDSVYFPKTREPLEHLVNNSQPGTWLISEEIEAFDASVDAIRWEGRFCASAYKVIYPKAKGISVIRRSIEAPGMIGTARKILDAVNYEGVCGFDFRITPDGKIYFLECNPRFTGGVLSAAASGLNLPLMLCRLALGKHSQSLAPGHHDCHAGMSGISAEACPSGMSGTSADDCAAGIMEIMQDDDNWGQIPRIRTGVVTIVWRELFRRLYHSLPGKHPRLRKI